MLFMNEREHKPIIWKAILCVIPSLAIFILAQTLLFLLLLVAGYMVCEIPVLGNLLNFLFSGRGDNISPFSTIVSIFAAYFVTTFIQSKMMKDAPTITLSRRILGGILAIHHIILLVINVFGGGYYLINIFCIIVSLGFMFHNKNEY